MELIALRRSISVRFATGDKPNTFNAENTGLNNGASKDSVTENCVGWVAKPNSI